MSSGARTPRALLAAAAVLLAPLAFRAALVADRTAAPALADLRGVLSDAGGALLALALLAALARLARPLAAAGAVLWVLLQDANYENVRALDALVSPHDIGFLADPTFLLGSALSLSRPLLLLALAAATPLLLWLGLGAAGGRRIGLPLLGGVALLGLHAAWPPADDAASWRQWHFLPYHALRLLEAGSPGPAAARDFPDPPAALLDWAPGLAADLGGASRLPPGPPAPNVLLVILEGVSGAHVPSLAEDHGRFFGGPPPMPGLDAIARENLAFSTFLTLQRKTNRGLYALLCGEPPNLVPGLPKMSEFVERGWRTCLPELLRDAGYRTVYLQAAPLAFMMKDQFMPKIGFDETHGQEWFQRHYARSKWGVDDRAFLEQSVAMVQQLAREPQPWFLTLLTVGTHHPFLVPEDFLPERRSDALRALAYLDLSFAAFIERLRERRLLDDTLVLVTSDESLGLQSQANPVLKTLSQNWGLLVALLPRPVAERVSTPYTQVDLALSILDYLDLAERGRHLFGRSVFRRYERGRRLFFANTNLLSAGSLTEDGHLLLCRDDYRHCERYALPASGRLFGPGRVRVAPDPEEVAFLRELARRSLHAHPDDDAPREFTLLADPDFTVDSAHDQLVHGGQYVDLRPGEWLEVDLEVSARSEAASARLAHLLWSTRSPPLYQSVDRLADGETLRLRYTFAPRRPLDGVRCRTLASSDAGPVALHFARASMRIHRRGTPPGPGVQVVEREVVAGEGTAARAR